MKRIIDRIINLFRHLHNILTKEEGVQFNVINIVVLILSLLFFFTVFYWTLWAMLVYKKGLFTKLIYITQLLFTEKTLRDFGYLNWSVRGEFSGLDVNVGAFLFLFFLFYLGNNVLKKVKK